MSGLVRSLARAGGAALIALIAISCGSSAQAARIIIINQPPGGGIIPQGGDPFYGFYGAAFLDVGYDVHIGDSFTIYAAPGVNADSITYQPDSNGGLVPEGDFWKPSFDVSPTQVTWPGVGGEQVDQSSITWTLTNHGPGAPIENCPDPNDPSPQPLYLGTFGFQTYADLSHLPMPFSITFDYTVHAHDCAGDPVDGGGSFTLTLVPEPSSIALLALGAAVPALSTARRRRRAV